jgi:hypothetical protein
MIELGALLGAMIITLGALILFGQMENVDGGGVVFAIFVIAPLLGALWGAAVAAVIHYTANGTVFGFAVAYFEVLTHRFH